MAKARDVPGLDAEVSYGAAAARAVAVRSEELHEQLEDVLDTDDIERVHDARVASRRLRAVLEIFRPCFPKQLYAPALRDVKALADALGARRDPDVQLAAMDAFSAAVGDGERPGVAVLAVRLRREQAAGNAILAAALEEARRSDLRGRLAALATAAEPLEPPPAAADPPAEEDPLAAEDDPPEDSPASGDPALEDRA